jgi:alpha-tubulin suppressor-like RCC1 family protein
VPVTGLDSGVASVSSGFGHTCAVLTGGTATCWGSNDAGQLGDATTTGSLKPMPVAGLS